MITVTLVTNNGSGLPRRINVNPGTSLNAFLNTHFDDDVSGYQIRVRANGLSVDAHEDYVLCDGDRVSVTPLKIEGAK